MPTDANLPMMNQPFLQIIRLILQDKKNLAQAVPAKVQFTDGPDLGLLPRRCISPMRKSTWQPQAYMMCIHLLMLCLFAHQPPRDHSTKHCA